MSALLAKLFFIGFLGASGLLLCGCAIMQPHSIDQRSAGVLQQRAKAWEGSGEMRKALLAYRAVQSLSSGDPAVAGSVQALRNRLREQAERHFAQGRRLVAQGRSLAARQAFMKALAAQPGHESALAGLRRIAKGSGHVAYTLRTGEGPREVAAKVYRDPEKAFLVAYFLDSHSNGALSSAGGRRVLLPRLDFELKREPPPVLEPRPAAGSMYAKEEGLVSRETSSKSDADGKASPAERYERGLRLKKAGNSAAAYQAFSSLSPEYKDVRKQLAAIKERLNTKAEVHYKKGLRHFLADDLDQAIEEWQQALSLNPDHIQARKSLHKARVLRKSLQEY